MRHFLLCVLLLAPLASVAQQKKDKGKKDQAKVILARPFGVAPGKTTKVVLRGLKLENAKELRVSKGTIKLLKKGKAAVPQQMDAASVGDSEVEADLTLPGDVAGDEVEVTVEVSDELKASRKLLIDRVAPVAEKEPNDGFDKAQPVKIGQTIDGAISRAQDVDVYRFEAKAGDKVVIEVFAARLGSALDSFLQLYDADKQILVTCDDIQDSTDSRIEATLQKAGTYYVSVTDAHDQGGPLHPYRLVIVKGK
jgi:hypothetical protein